MTVTFVEGDATTLTGASTESVLIVATGVGFAAGPGLAATGAAVVGFTAENSSDVAGDSNLEERLASADNDKGINTREIVNRNKMLLYLIFI